MTQLIALINALSGALGAAGLTVPDLKALLDKDAFEMVSAAVSLLTAIFLYIRHRREQKPATPSVPADGKPNGDPS